jgi:hypothetical protein
VPDCEIFWGLKSEGGGNLMGTCYRVVSLWVIVIGWLGF